MINLSSLLLQYNAEMW